MEEKVQLMSKLMSNRGVCRTSPATPGLLSISRHYRVAMVCVVSALFFIDVRGENQSVLESSLDTDSESKRFPFGACYNSESV